MGKYEDIGDSKMIYKYECPGGNTEENTIDWEFCHSCKEQKWVQQLPAESNAGEFFVVYLCASCLIKLVHELIIEKPNALDN